MSRTQKVYVAFAALMVLAAGIVLGIWWAGSSSSSTADGQAASASGEREVLYWYDPMEPGQHFDKPGKSPFMDMQLVPKYADETTGSGISITPGTRANLGIRTVEAERGSLSGTISVPGTIGWDLRQEHVVSARVDSVVDRLFVKAPYEPVRAGQPLAGIIAPTWTTALAEVQALRQADSAAALALQPAARERLRALGLPSHAQVSNGRIVLTAPVNGIVSEIAVREGAAASAGTLLFRVNGTDTVWLEAAIPQAGLSGVTPGTPVEAHVSAIPGRVFEGRVESLLPQIDAGSRTQRARIVLENPEGLLVPGMFAQVTFGPVESTEHVLVPSDAVIGAGAQARVVVVETDGQFRPVAVQTGRSGDGKTQILSGLQEGQRVVASGQFLIDSEASLSGALERLDATPADEMPAMPDRGPVPDAEPGAEAEPTR